MVDTLRRNVRVVVARVATAIASEIGRDEIYFYGGLVLVAIGCWDLWRPGAFIVPGVALIWVSMPCRAAFVDRPQEPKKG